MKRAAQQQRPMALHEDEDDAGQEDLDIRALPESLALQRLIEASEDKSDSSLRISWNTIPHDLLWKIERYGSTLITSDPTLGDAAETAATLTPEKLVQKMSEHTFPVGMFLCWTQTEGYRLTFTDVNALFYGMLELCQLVDAFDYATLLHSCISGMSRVVNDDDVSADLSNEFGNNRIDMST